MLVEASQVRAHHSVQCHSQEYLLPGPAAVPPRPALCAHLPPLPPPPAVLRRRRLAAGRGASSSSSSSSTSSSSSSSEEESRLPRLELRDPVAGQLGGQLHY